MSREKNIWVFLMRAKRAWFPGKAETAFIEERWSLSFKGGRNLERRSEEREFSTAQV